MNLEALLSGIFALGLPVWLLIEQFIHGLGRLSPSRPLHLPERNEPKALRRAA